MTERKTLRQIVDELNILRHLEEHHRKMGDKSGADDINASMIKLLDDIEDVIRFESIDRNIQEVLDEW